MFCTLDVLWHFTVLSTTIPPLIYTGFRRRKMRPNDLQPLGPLPNENPGSAPGRYANRPCPRRPVPRRVQSGDRRPAPDQSTPRGQDSPTRGGRAADVRLRGAPRGRRQGCLSDCTRTSPVCRLFPLVLLRHRLSQSKLWHL